MNRRLVACLGAFACLLSGLAADSPARACGLSMSYSQRISISAPHAGSHDHLAAIDQARRPKGQTAVARLPVRPPAPPPPSPEQISAQLIVAEERLDDGKLSEACRAVLEVLPGVRSQSAERAAPREARAQRTLALAALRSDGAALEGGRGATAAQRKEALRWANETLRALSRREPDSPVALTDLGEALTTSPATAGEGREILEALAREDLIVHGRGWAALARQRSSAGDADGAKAAFVRCEQMVGAAGSCGAAPASRERS